MNSHGTATIDFSAVFGGRDAAAAVLPHFKALKAAAKGITLNGFPYPQLAFILRVDGDVNQYGFSGTGNPDVDNEGMYLSVDIGIAEEDRDNIRSRITSAIRDSLPIIAAAVSDRGIDNFDADGLRDSLELLRQRYTEVWS
ncbi:MAG: hypothetical protein WBC44_12065 [Planctomycetaceae bacterium]